MNKTLESLKKSIYKVRPKGHNKLDNEFLVESTALAVTFVQKVLKMNLNSLRDKALRLYEYNYGDTILTKKGKYTSWYFFEVEEDAEAFSEDFYFWQQGPIERVWLSKHIAPNKSQDSAYQKDPQKAYTLEKICHPDYIVYNPYMIAV